jgi:hypothetical protein
MVKRQKHHNFRTSGSIIKKAHIKPSSFCEKCIQFKKQFEQGPYIQKHYKHCKNMNCSNYDIAFKSKHSKNYDKHKWNLQNFIQDEINTYKLICQTII